VTRIATEGDLTALSELLARPGSDFILVETSVDSIRPRRRD